MTDSRQIGKSGDIVSDSSKPKKKHVIMVFLACSIFNLILLMVTEELSPAPDYIGVMFGAARLAGLDWSGIAESYRYYGQAYYIIFAPLFLITDNPFVRHIMLQTINLIILGGFGALIYYIAISYFKCKDGLLTTILPVLIVCLTVNFEADDASNEIPVFLVVWVVCFILVHLCKIERRKSRICLTIVLVAVLYYGYLIHTRLLGLVAVVVFAVLIDYLIHRKWVVEPLAFFPGMVIGYLGAIWIRNLQYSEIWGGRDATEIGNASLEGIVSTNSIPGIKTILDIVISNVYAFTIGTYGLAVIAVVFAAYLVYRMIISIKKRRLTNLCDDIGLSREQFLILLTFGACIVGTILGLCTMWGNHIEGIITTGNSGDVWNRRGLFYIRYYEPYFGPVMLALYAYFLTKRKTAIKLCLISIAALVLLYLYVKLGIVPYAGKLPAYSFEPWPFGFGTMEVMAAIIALFIAAYAFCLRKSYGRHFYISILSVILVIRLSAVSWPFFSYTLPPNLSDIYRAIDSIKQENVLPYDIHTTIERADLIQFWFSHNRVIQRAPDESAIGDSIFICDEEPSEEHDALYESGFMPYEMEAGSHTIWLRGDGLNEAMGEFVGETR